MADQKMTFEKRLAAITRLENAAARGEQWAIDMLALIDDELSDYEKKDRDKAGVQNVA